MSLLKTVTLYNVTCNTHCSATPPTVELRFLKNLDLMETDADLCSKLVEHLLFLASTRLYIQIWDTEPDNVGQFITAIVSKAAGYGLTGPAIPLHTLRVSSFQDDGDAGSLIRIGRGDNFIEGFCDCMVDVTSDVPDILQSLSSTTHTLHQLRILVIGDQDYDGGWQQAQNPREFWSDSFYSLVSGLKSLCFVVAVWPLQSLAPCSREVIGSYIPHLRQLRLECMCFRDLSSLPSPVQFIERLWDMLNARKMAGIPLFELHVDRDARFT